MGSGRHHSGRRCLCQRRIGLPIGQRARVGVLVGEEPLPSLTCWDDGRSKNGRGLDSPQKKRVQEMRAERRTMSISQLARKASLEFGKKVPWTTAYDATAGVHKSLKRVRVQYISPQNVTKRLLWCQLLLARLGLRKGVFTTKVRGCTLDQLCFSDEKLFERCRPCVLRTSGVGCQRAKPSQTP